MSIRHSIIVLLSLQFIITLTMASVVSLAPVMAIFFNVPTTQVFLLNIGFMLSGIFSPFFGYFADKHGVKRMLVLGAFTFTLGTLLTAFATNPSVYIFTRMLVGIGHNVFFGLVAAYSAKLVDKETVIKISGYYKLAFAGGIFVSPVIAGLIVLNYSFELFYLIVFGIALILSILMLRLPEPEDLELIPMTINDFSQLFKTPIVQWTLLMSLLIAVAPNSIFSFLGIHLSSLGFSQVYISFAYTILGFGSLVSGFIILFLRTKFSFSRFLTYGLYGVILTLIGFITNITWLAIPTAFLFAVSFDLVIGVLFPYIAQLPSQKSASFISLVSLTMAITAIVITILNPITFAFGGYQLMAGISFVATILGFLCFVKTERLIKKA